TPAGATWAPPGHPVRPASERDPWMGRKLGNYLITGKLGQGGMGVVYEAYDTLLKRPVAIKMLPEAAAAAAAAQDRFLLEAQATARLSHPNVVAIYEVDQFHEAFFIVMELVRGHSAQQVLEAGVPFPWAQAVHIVTEVCRGLTAAHAAGLIHRDI